MKKNTVELIVGASILVAAFILVAGVLWLKEVSINARMVQYTVVFPQIGALQTGDPVMVAGVRKGNVRSLQLQQDGVWAVLNLESDVILTDSAVITVQNIGLMGERVVGILPSPGGSVIPPDNLRTGESTPVQGRFDSGIAEAMGAVGTVLADVTVLLRNVKSVLDQTVGDSSFTSIFQTTVGRLDTVGALVEELVAGNKEGIDATLRDVRAVAADLRRLVSDNQEGISSIVDDGNRLTTQALAIASDIEQVAASVREILSAIEKGEGTLGRLMQDEVLYENIKQTMGKLDTLITDVQDDGLRLRIRLGFGRTRR